MAAFGFRPVRYQNGSPWNGATVRVGALAATGNLFVGDAVVMDGTATTSTVDGAILSNVVAAGTGAASPAYGIITSVIATVGVPNLNIVYGPTGTYRELLVALCEPSLILETTSATAMIVTGGAATALQGFMFQMAAGAGNTTTGVSGHSLTGAGAATPLPWWFVGVKNEGQNLATVGSVVANTTVISTAATPTIIEVACVAPQMGMAILSVGVT